MSANPAKKRLFSFHPTSPVLSDSGSTGVKQGKGGMPYGDYNPAVAVGRRRGFGRGAGGGRFGGCVDPGGLLPGAVGRGGGRGGTVGRGPGLGVSHGGRGRGWPGGFGGWAVDNEQAEGAEEPDNDGQGIAAGGGESQGLWGGSAPQWEHGIVDGQATGEAGLEHAVPQEQGQVLANDADLGGEEDVNDADGSVEAEDEHDEVDGDDFDVPMAGGGGFGGGGGFPPAFPPPGVHIGGPFVPGGVPVLGAGVGPPQHPPPRVVGGGHVLGGGDDELAAAARDATGGQGGGSEDRAAAIREQRLARLTGGGGGGGGSGGGGGEDGSGDGGSGNEGDGGRSRSKAAVGTLQVGSVRLGESGVCGVRSRPRK